MAQYWHRDKQINCTEQKTQTDPSIHGNLLDEKIGHTNC